MDTLWIRRFKIWKIKALRECHLHGVELGGDGNNHSSQPPKLHPMDTSTHIYII